MSLSPHTEYNRRLTDRLTTFQAFERRDRLISTARLITGLASAILLWLVFVSRLLSPWWLLVPLATFCVLLILHEWSTRRKTSADKAVRFYRSGINRLNDNWIDDGNTGLEFLDESHLYAADLDLFGKGSVFQLLSIARTRAGEETLAAWLCSPSSREIVRKRQAAVEDLRMRLGLREELARLGEDIQSAIHTSLIERWATSPPLLDSLTARIIAPLLVATMLFTFIGWLYLGFSVRPLLIALLLEAVFGFIYWRRVRRVRDQVEQPRKELKLLSLILKRLEQEEFKAPRLQELRAQLSTGGVPPSRQIAGLSRLADRLDDRRNMIFQPVSYFLLWSTQFAFAIEAWRKRCGDSVGKWLAAVGEMEALSSLAAYAYEHPADPFPEILENGPCFAGEELGHPLIPESKCVRNSLRLDGNLQLLMVSGSNMSGKTTLLRTIGVNAVLGLAGAPVRARSLKFSPLMPGATLRVHDSLQEGKSRFYAEILRLRQILNRALGPIPVLFLLDEILHGTNSHDRLIGVEAVIGSLLERGAVGLVTTHDLALTHIAESLAPRASNVHFQDFLSEGKMIFDYRVHPGVVQKSNALDLMRSIGLDV